MKPCIRCGESFPISEFYRHPKMSDGHINACKKCVKRDADARYKSLMEDPEWAKAERARQREKQRRAQKTHRGSIVSFAHNAVKGAIRRGELSRLPCEKCGNKKSEAHHDDYTKPLSVRWLCKKHHIEHHIIMRENDT